MTDDETAGEIIRRRLGPQPEYDAAVAWWRERIMANPPLPGLPVTREQANLRGGPR